MQRWISHILSGLSTRLISYILRQQRGRTSLHGYSWFTGCTRSFQTYVYIVALLGLQTLLLPMLSFAHLREGRWYSEVPERPVHVAKVWKQYSNNPK